MSEVAARPEKVPVHRRLVARIYLYTVFATLVVGALAFVIAASSRVGHEHHRGGLSGYLVERLASLRDDPHALAAEAQAMKAASRAAISLYDVSGTLLVQVGRHTSVPPDVDLQALGRGEVVTSERGTQIFPVLEDGALVAYGVARMPPMPRGFRPQTLVTVVVALALLFVVSFLLARSLSRPLRALAKTAEKLGQGDLSARAELTTRDEFATLGHSFDIMADRLEQMVKSQRQLIANISHELRTPLSRVRVVLDLIADTEESASTRARLTEINRDFEDLERLVDDVLTAARFDIVENGPFPMRSAKLVALSDLVDAAKARFLALYDKSHTLSIEMPQEPIYIRVDAPSLRRALGNLMDNARKYSSAGTTVTVRVTRLETRVAVEIVDQGMGIDGDDLEHLFTPFFRSDKSRTRKTGGVGLGLTITKRILEAHGGSIAVDSAPASGTTIRFELPMQVLTEDLPVIES